MRPNAPTKHAYLCATPRAISTADRVSSCLEKCAQCGTTGGGAHYARSHGSWLHHEQREVAEYVCEHGTIVRLPWRAKLGRGDHTADQCVHVAAHVLDRAGLYQFQHHNTRQHGLVVVYGGAQKAAA